VAELTALQAEVVARIKEQNRARGDSSKAAQAAQWAIDNGVTPFKAASTFRLPYYRVKRQYQRLRTERATPQVEPFEHVT
jgi:hypothetical protein